VKSSISEFYAHENLNSLSPTLQKYLPDSYGGSWIQNSKIKLITILED
jgi:hypothetical protein